VSSPHIQARLDYIEHVYLLKTSNNNGTFMYLCGIQHICGGEVCGRQREKARKMVWFMPVIRDWGLRVSEKWNMQVMSVDNIACYLTDNFLEMLPGMLSKRPLNFAFAVDFPWCGQVRKKRWMQNRTTFPIAMRFWKCDFQRFVHTIQHFRNIACIYRCVIAPNQGLCSLYLKWWHKLMITE
jgi:hypothetical protein